ncbi:MAG: transcription elongation factor Spt5 [Candidatus Aenigmarchaeota archaeon]|nr:transcription elongation factor Spt5 [Candidatus Aenigmarchaeota archaeon]
MIYAVRTTSGRENIVIDLLEDSIKARGYNINAVVHPAEIKGYIFIEGNVADIHKAVHGVMHIKGVIEKPISIGEVERFLVTKKKELNIGMEDIVEIIGGPFSGEKGKVKRIDVVKEEITIELLEAAIPIPVTISIELIKLIKKNEGNQE